MDNSKIMQDLEKAPILHSRNLPKQVMYMADKGKHSCEACRANDGKRFNVDAADLPQLPIHPNCRCKYVDLGNPEKELSSEVGQYRTVQNLEGIHKLPEDLANDLASQISDARNENAILREQKLFLLFNGRYFISSDGKLLLDAVSGKSTEEKSATEIITRKFNYSYDRQGQENIGGLPVGLYYILSKEERSALASPYSHIVKRKGWGNYSWSLHPVEGYDMRGRKNFFIHGGRDFGSAGCIDLQAGDTMFQKYFTSIKQSSIYILVRYSKEDVEIQEKR